MPINAAEFKIPVADASKADNNLPLHGYTIVVATCGSDLGIGRNGESA